MLCLALPHICEELWEIAGNKNFISITLWSDFDKEFINDELEIEFEFVSNVIDDILNVKKIIKTQETDNIYLYTAPKWKYDVLELIISKQGNFKTIVEELKKCDNL